MGRRAVGILPAPSSTGTLPLLVPVSTTAAVPRPRLTRAVGASEALVPPLATATMPVTLAAVPLTLPATLPVRLPVTLPVRLAVMVPAAKLPEPSRLTTVEAPVALAAVRVAVLPRPRLVRALAASVPPVPPAVSGRVPVTLALVRSTAPVASLSELTPPAAMLTLGAL